MKLCIESIHKILGDIMPCIKRSPHSLYFYNIQIKSIGGLLSASISVLIQQYLMSCRILNFSPFTWTNYCKFIIYCQVFINAYNANG